MNKIDPVVLLTRMFWGMAVVGTVVLTATEPMGRYPSGRSGTLRVEPVSLSQAKLPATIAKGEK